MKRWLVPVVSFVLTASATAYGQSPPGAAAPAPPMPTPVTAVNVRPAQLKAPDLPEEPTALRATIERLTRVADQTSECWTENAERVSHTADRRCPNWYSQLSRDHAATAFAIGRMLVGTTSRYGGQGRTGDPMTTWRTLPRLMQVLADTEEPSAVAFLVTALVNEANQGTAPTERTFEMIHALQRLTGQNPRPQAPWVNRWDLPEGTTALEMGAAEWAAWYDAHKTETRDQWLRAGDQDALQKLNASDDTVRYNAIERLLGRTEHRATATTALRAMIARADLPAPVRNQLTQLARSERITLPRTPAARRPRS